MYSGVQLEKPMNIGDLKAETPVVFYYITGRIKCFWRCIQSINNL